MLGSYELMHQCWQQKPNLRPIFSELKDSMAVMLQNNNVCVIIKCFFSAKTNITMTEYDFKTKDLMNIQKLSKDKNFNYVTNLLGSGQQAHTEENPSGCDISLPEKSAS